MSTTALYKALTEAGVSGDSAERAVEGLAHVGEVATKADLARLEASLRTEMAELKTELKTDMANLETGLRNEMAELRNELRNEMAEVRTDMASLETRLTRWIFAATALIIAAMGLIVRL